MAKFQGIIIDKELAKTVTIYQMNGRIYLRSKSSLSRKRVLKSKAFVNTRRHASDMGKASRIGSAIYQEIGNKKKDRSLYQAITGEAASLLYEGIGEVDVVERLRRKWL